ncbi:alpha/beta hydrolase fold domain-containing protein [Lindgomyces ingoldianus]|uniref:Alpha/beta hydrolase fold domain-containing protein n=1 Tax=Lindgomyces ingoldianus TaxID=673940 RepID=A0ACB6QPG6_9PLEO|nr:alpha/beta hydrolase fold domain-containing protein [Lindgomyces ingoldianus]KAF2468919.1 alpha/beta hydrolase fold domain-containing protein [Lindgomyces ingoldianus]
MADQSVSKLGIASVTLRAILSASVRLWISPFKGQKGAQNYFKDVMFAMMRTQLANLSLAQDRYLNPPTTPTYIAFAKAQGFAPESIKLPGGAQAHWIGNTNAKKLIVYYHGGGYVIPANAGQMQYLMEMKDSLIAQGSDTAVVFLAYDLAPEFKYPTQLKQAVELLQYLVETQGRNPSDITLGGDSAGGNLTIGVLSHLSHPHPDIPALNLPSKLHAAFLLSPWCSFNTHTPTFLSNAEKDIFDGRALSRWSSAFLGSDSPFAGDLYNEPALAPASWWEPTADVIEEVLIWGGANEILLDGIEEFARRFQKGFGGKGGKVSTIITAKAAHEEMILERLLGYKGDSGTGSAQVVQDWVKAKL